MVTRTRLGEVGPVRLRFTDHKRPNEVRREYNAAARVAFVNASPFTERASLGWRTCQPEGSFLIEM